MFGRSPLDPELGYLLREAMALVDAGLGGRSQVLVFIGLTGLNVSSSRIWGTLAALGVGLENLESRMGGPSSEERSIWTLNDSMEAEKREEKERPGKARRGLFYYMQERINRKGLSWMDRATGEYEGVNQKYRWKIRPKWIATRDIISRSVTRKVNMESSSHKACEEFTTYLSNAACLTPEAVLATPVFEP